MRSSTRTSTRWCSNPTPTTANCSTPTPSALPRAAASASWPGATPSTTCAGARTICARCSPPTASACATRCWKTTTVRSSTAWRRHPRPAPTPPRSCAAHSTPQNASSPAAMRRATAHAAPEPVAPSRVNALDNAAILPGNHPSPPGGHMAKFKKTAKKKTAGSGSRSSADDVQAQAEKLSKTLSESAQQIWLAGVGAFGRAQAEGTKLFEGLVKEGLNLEQTARRFADSRGNAVRDVVENRVDQARERATDTWDRLEKVFEDRVQRALTRLGVPGRDDLADLSARVEGLTAELRRQGGAPARKAPARKKAAKAAPTAKKATRKTAKTATGK